MFIKNLLNLKLYKIIKLNLEYNRTFVSKNFPYNLNLK